MPIKLQIYILCRDRLEYSIKSIESVIKSANFYTEVVISDNSSTNLVEKMCQERFPATRYIRRMPPLSSEAHFKAIVDEANADFLVMFHDDDIMLENYVTTLLPFIEANPTVAAVACNAEIIDRYGKGSGNYFMKDALKPIDVINSEDFIYPYLTARLGNMAPPFPSYIYRRKYISSHDINYKDGGKHLDVTLLLKILRKSSMIWHPKILMHYRYHDLNDSARESICNRSSLTRYLVSQEGVDPKSKVLLNFKFSYWLNWWRYRHKRRSFFIPRGWREKVVFIFLFTTSIRFAFSDLNFWKERWRKVIKLIIG
jgi:hypothetical protein